jgi:hypothetical protein
MESTELSCLQLQKKILKIFSDGALGACPSISFSSPISRLDMTSGESIITFIALPQSAREAVASGGSLTPKIVQGHQI